MRIYCIRTIDGKFFRAKGFGGYGDSFTDDATKARYWGSSKPAKSQITFFKNHYPDYPPLILTEINGEII